MVKALEQVCLCKQAIYNKFATLLVLGKRNLFHGPLLTKRSVHSKPDYRHSAFTNLSQKTIPAADNSLRL